MKTIYPSDLVEEIDAALADGGEGEGESMLEAMKSGLRELAAK